MAKLDYLSVDADSHYYEPHFEDDVPRLVVRLIMRDNTVGLLGL